MGLLQLLEQGVTIKSGNIDQVHVNQWATSYLSNHDPRVHIGLGQNKNVDQLEIIWSNGKKEIYYNLDCRSLSDHFRRNRNPITKPYSS